MISNDLLKLNKNAIVDNLNLINIVHDPLPITFEKPVRDTTQKYARPRNYFSSADDNYMDGNSYEFVDEQKMSMYSYLVQRELKTKQWLSKFESENEHEQEMNSISNRNRVGETGKKEMNKEVAKKKSVDFVDKKSESLKSNSSSNISIPKSSSSSLIPTRDTVSSNTKLAKNKAESEISELVKCCDESLRAIEQMSKQLNEFKNERLKIIYNDPIEEEKQRRIQLEQIKHLSRSMYNLQNQMGTFKKSLANVKEPEQGKKDKSSSLMSPIGRLTHTMRQVNKLVNTFSDLYPYRPDNDVISEKLYLHFYKQLHFSITNFTECINGIFVKNMTTLNDQLHIDKTKAVSSSLLGLLVNCDQFFVDVGNCGKEKIESVDSNYLVKHSSSNENDLIGKRSVLNVIRVSRSTTSVKSNKSKDGGVKPVEFKLNDKSNDLRIEISPSPSRQESVKRGPQFEKKKVQTARLFPSRAKPKLNFIKTKPAKKPIVTIKKSEKPTKEETTPSEEFKKLNLKTWHSNEELNNLDKSPTRELISYRGAPRNDFVDGNERQERPIAFHHQSTPPKYFNRQKGSTSRSASNERIQRSNDKFYTHHSPSSSNSARSRSISSSPVRNYRPAYSDQSHEDLNISIDLEELKLKYNNDFGNMKARFNQSHNDEFKFDEKFGKKLFKTSQSRKRNAVSPLSSVNVKFPESTRKLISRIDLIKKESDLIRRKYENLNYHHDLIEQTLVNDKARRPYEECYLVDDAIVKQEYESKIDFNKVYKPLKHGSIDQLKRVIDYSKKFSDYSKQANITTIGETKFDDFELFELLSDSLFEDYFSSVYNEVESINDEFASNLINAEFVLSKSNETSLRDQQDLSRNHNESHDINYNYKTKKSSATNNNINNTYDQINTSYSSFQSNKEDETTRVDDDDESSSSLNSYSK